MPPMGIIMPPMGTIMPPRDTAAMRAVRAAEPPPFGELLSLLQQWQRSGPSGAAAATGGRGCDSVLLHGRLGCGKSTLARALCAELGLPLHVVGAATAQLPRQALEAAVGGSSGVLLLEQLDLLAPAAGAVAGADGTAALLPWLQRARGSGSTFVIGCCGQVAAVHPRVRRWFDDECELPAPSSSTHRRLLLALLLGGGGDGGVTGAADRRVLDAEQLVAEVEPLCTAQSYVLADDVALVREARLLAMVNASGGAATSDGAPSPGRQIMPSLVRLAAAPVFCCV